ncbi:MAG TPA: hypothetical protein P5572_03765 [Phycisphaerae bacterium]|nr:hypothetical protein [Phycisphaerales bacterium]HRX84114.1 hypothetical protein [Phycisphaerae bacterium]
MASLYLTVYRRTLPIADAPDRWAWLSAVQQAVEDSPNLRVTLSRYNECRCEARIACYKTYRVVFGYKTAVVIRARVRLIRQGGVWRLMFSLQALLVALVGALVFTTVCTLAPILAISALLARSAPHRWIDAVPFLGVLVLETVFVYLLARPAAGAVREGRELRRVILGVMNRRTVG